MHEKRTSKRSLALLVATILCGGGCATTYRVQVDAVSNAGAAGDGERLSYRLVSASPEHAEEDLAAQQMAELARTALSSKGLFEAPPGVAPDLEIHYDFSLSAPQRRIVEREVFRCQEAPAVAGASGPPPLLMHTETEQALVIEYEKTVRLSAREGAATRADRPPREVWSVVATSVDPSDDLGHYVPILVAAAMDEIATHQPAPREVRVSANDDRVVFVQHGL